MALEKEFTARFFSNDCADKFDNTLSAFTIEYEDALVFDRPYEMGVSQLFLNPCANDESMKHHSLDMIAIPLEGTKRQMTHDEYIHTLLRHSVAPYIYNRGYFAPYLDKNVFFDPYYLDYYFPKHKQVVTEVNKRDAIAVVHDMTKHLYGGETLGDFMLPHRKNDVKHLEKFKNLKIPGYANEMITMHNVINNLVRYVIHFFRDTNQKTKTGDFDDSVAAHERNVLTQVKAPSAEITVIRRKHLEATNVMVNRTIENFVSTVQDEIIKMRNANEIPIELPPKRFIFIYCDAVSGQLSGPNRLKLLYVTPFDSFVHNVTKEKLFFNEHVLNIQYARIEKKTLKQISFLMLDENGEQINFQNSHTSNFIAIRFRRVDDV